MSDKCGIKALLDIPVAKIRNIVYKALHLENNLTTFVLNRYLLMKRLLLLCFFPMLAFAQIQDRYFEQCRDTLPAECLGAGFYRTVFSKAPQAFYLNESAWGDGQAWEVCRQGERYSFLAAGMRHAFASYAEEGFKADSVRVPADRETYEALGRLFRRANRLAEDVDGWSSGLDGYTCYLASSDSAGRVSVGMKWTPAAGSLTCALTSLCDSIYRRIRRHETDWTPVRLKADSLLQCLEKEPLLEERNPVYRGIWRQGLQLKDSVVLGEQPRFPGPRGVDAYFNAYMNYPARLLAEGQGGYAVCQFTIDTLGFARMPFVLEKSHPEFAREVCRLILDMPHWLPARDVQGRAVECMYCVYVPFRPQRYYARLKADSLWRGQEQHVFADPYDLPPQFPGGMKAFMQFMKDNVRYPQAYVGSGRSVRVPCQLEVDEYGFTRQVSVLRSSGIPEFDAEALRVLSLLPRWETPRIYGTPRPHYTSCRYVVPVTFTDPGR